MKTNRGLGRGLSALFSDTEEAYENAAKTYSGPDNELPEDIQGLIEVDIDLVRPNPNQPRKHFDEDALRELADSIKKHGLIMPIVVNNMENGKYMIIAGERRYRAAKMAGKTQIPIVIRSYTDREIKEISLIENLQREDLNPIEAANAMKQLMDEYRLTQEELAERIGKSRPAVTNTLRLLSLSPEVIGMVSSGKLSAGHARALVTLPEDAQYKLASDAVKDGLSVRDIERSVRDYFASPEEIAEKKDKKKMQVSIELKDLIERMRHTFKTKVSLIGNDKKGRIYIDYYNTDDLDRISEIVEMVDRQENR
ncbi:MAG TPA: ParB/RepB/Spo0J family partition protein [Candidatus Borkfalkia excrementavium]|uniref:ParB/RepB/Spo0J family partition protein n=1 Tax=Candidatus Borkfalkia excrementavium TaxID=2838505 RepID=A0A9D2CG39_9FIRM|nr:ParB/RepB/Spo0J family partition protein [Candidatus Borkfalkia excrementavium]